MKFDHLRKTVTLSGMEADLSNLFIRLVFLGIPGFLCIKLYWKLTGRSSTPTWVAYLEIGLFSLVCYLLVSLPTSVHNLIWPSEGSVGSKAIVALFDPKAGLDFTEIFWACLVAIPLAYGLSYIDRRKWVVWVGHFLHVTNRSGDEDIWHYLNNSPHLPEWVVVRDLKRNVVYYGQVRAFSDSKKERELLMSEVTVFNGDKTDGNPLYLADILYVSRRNDDLVIEANPRPWEPEADKE